MTVTGKATSAVPPVPKGLSIVPAVPNPKYADLGGLAIAALVLVSILLIVKYARGFIANISVLLGIVIGAVVATIFGFMTFEKVGSAAWFDIVLPFHFGMPKFDPVLILTMSLIMVVVRVVEGLITDLALTASSRHGRLQQRKTLPRPGIGMIHMAVGPTVPGRSRWKGSGCGSPPGRRPQ